MDLYEEISEKHRSLLLFEAAAEYQYAFANYIDGDEDLFGYAAQSVELHCMKYQEICGQKIWFEQGLPNASEYRRAIENLRASNMEVDYIITHIAPTSIIYRLIGRTSDTHDVELTGLLDWVYHEEKFKKWYFGRFHKDTQVSQ